MQSELTLSDNSLDKLPPQSIEAEQAVLGALLVNGEAISRVADIVRHEYFYRKAHQVIYAAMLDLFEKGEPIDIVTISQYLKDAGTIENIGGRQYLTDLAMSVATTANVEYYAKVVHEKSLVRNLIRAGTEIVQSCYEDSEAAILIDNAERLIFSLAEQREMKQLVHIRDIVEVSFARIEERYENRDSLSGTPSGFYDLDALTSGFQPSDLIIVAARPSMGKTALCLSFAQHAAVELNVPVAIFSLEMSREQLVQRMLCSLAEIDATRLRTGYLQNNDWNRLAMAMGRLGEAPIYIDDSAVTTALDIRAKCRRLKAEQKALGLIVIDYIQLMQGRKVTDNRQQEVSEISRSLKTLARELEVPVIALSQLSRAVESRQSKKPMLSDLRESGCLAGESRVFLPDECVHRRIDSLVGKAGFNVLALNEATGKLERRPVTHAFSTGRKPVHKLSTRLNRTIRATANHKFLTIEGWKRLDELVPGMRIAIPRHLPASAEKTMTPAEVVGLTKRQMQAAMHMSCRGAGLYKSALSRKRAARVATIVKSEELARLSDGDVYWDEVLEIVPNGETEVYDLTVDGLHNFVAENITVHNSIEQDADIVMFIYRDEYYNQESERRGEADIIIAKQRNGPVGEVQLLFQSSITRFLNKVHTSQGYSQA